jgi:hypothetical protein
VWKQPNCIIAAHLPCGAASGVGWQQLKSRANRGAQACRRKNRSCAFLIESAAFYEICITPGNFNNLTKQSQSRKISTSMASFMVGAWCCSTQKQDERKQGQDNQRYQM